MPPTFNKALQLAIGPALERYYGGGEIRFDGKVIRKDGKFLLPELKPLNY